MGKTFYIVALLMTVLCAEAQDQVSDTIPGSVTIDVEGNTINPPKRMQTNVILGTQFSGSSYYGTGLTTFISPSISYNVSPRFSVRGGLTISNTSLFNYRPWYAVEGTSPFDANFSKALIYLEGTYRITERLTISGAGFKEFTIADNSPINNPFSKNEPYGIYLNAQYKITERAFFQVGFGYTKGYSPYIGSPMYDPSPFSGGAFSPSPLQRDPFNSRPFGW